MERRHVGFSWIFQPFLGSQVAKDGNTKPLPLSSNPTTQKASLFQDLSGICTPLQAYAQCGFKYLEITYHQIWANIDNNVLLVKIEGPVTDIPSITITCCEWAGFKPLHWSTSQWEMDIYRIRYLVPSSSISTSDIFRLKMDCNQTPPTWLQASDGLDTHSPLQQRVMICSDMTI